MSTHEFPDPQGLPASPATVEAALQTAGIAADRITALSGGRWAILDTGGGGLAGLAYETGVSCWCVRTEGEIFLAGPLGKAVARLADFVRDYDELS